MSPGEKLKEFIANYINENSLDENLVMETPKKWEKYGDFILFDERTFCSPVWKNLEIDFWVKLSTVLKCNRIGIKSKITNDSYRTPNVVIVLGNDPWVLHRDNSLTYTWNVEKCMFSSGNACERHRIANFNCEGEVVVDLFAGIGYFTIPFLVHGKANFLHACEWNPAAIDALKRNLVLNKVSNKCTVYEGDNRLVCPRKIANRVNLGLIPSSEDFWKTACEALVENGGVLHIHENVETKKDEVSCQGCVGLQSKINIEGLTKGISLNAEACLKLEKTDIIWKHKQWILKGIHILHSLISILFGLNSEKPWSCTIEGLNFVKSYAPHVNHLVFDVRVECIPLC